MPGRMEQFAAALRAAGDAPMEVLSHETPTRRRTCFACGARRQGSMVVTIDRAVFTACEPCTLRILRLDAPG